MASKLPYMQSPGLVPKIFDKMQEARRPERFTQDFLETKLGFSGGSARAVLPLLKRMGFIGPDGTPTKLYDQFRNVHSQGFAVADGLRTAYSELYDRNDYAHDLPKDKLTGLITEITGASKDDTATRCIVSTFLALKEYADFDAAPAQNDLEPVRVTERVNPIPSNEQVRAVQTDDVDFRVSYTINLNLPETTNPDVFNAIFRALKEHLLTRQ